MYPTIENGVTVLHADDGMKLTNGSSYVTTVRLGKEDDGASWSEITAEEAEKRMNEDVPTENDATDEDYQAALREMGVKV